MSLAARGPMVFMGIDEWANASSHRHDAGNVVMLVTEVAA